MTRPALLIALLFAACAPAERNGEVEAPSPAPAPESAAPAPASPETPARPSGPVRAPRFLRIKLSGISMEALVFDSRTQRMIVADQPGGPASRWPDARAAGRALGGIAAINGGFFTPEGDPLGRVVSTGKPTGSINRASSLGSGFYVEAEAGPALSRREAFSGGREALQTGPFLVEKGRRVGGLSSKSSSARSFVATDGRYGWIVARTGACSLAQLADALETASIGGLTVENALNLDGGRSSEIWVSGTVQGGSVFTRPLWNKPVRNFLIIKDRD